MVSEHEANGYGTTGAVALVAGIVVAVTEVVVGNVDGVVVVGMVVGGGSVFAGVIAGPSLIGSPANAATRNIRMPNALFQRMPQKRPLAAPMPTRMA